MSPTAEVAVPVVIALIVKRVEAVAAVELLVDFEVEVRVAVPLVDAAALADDLRNLAAALLCSCFVRLFSCLSWRLGFGRGAASGSLGEFSLWDDESGWMSGLELARLK